MKYSRNFLQISLLIVALFISVQAVQPKKDSRLRVARALERAGQYENALGIYRQLFDEGHNSTQMINGLKNCFQNLHQYEAMIRFFTELTRKFPRDITYKTYLAGAYYLNNEKERAFAIWESVYQSKPYNIYKYRFVAGAMAELRLLDQAIEVYRQALRRLPKQKSLFRDIAYLYRAQLNYEQAVHYYLLFYQNYRQQKYFVRSQLLSMTKDQEATKRIIKALAAFSGDRGGDVFLQELHGELLMRIKDYPAALEIYRQLHKHNAQASYLERFALQAAANGAYQYALSAYDELLKEQPRRAYRRQILLARARACFRYGQLLAQKHDEAAAGTQVKEAQKILQEITTEKLGEPVYYQALELRGDIAFNYYADVDGALVLYKQLLKFKLKGQTPDRLRFKIARALLRKNNLPQARRYLQHIRRPPYQRLAALELADLDYFQGRFKLALKQYRQILFEGAAEDSLTNNALQRIILIEDMGQDSLTLRKYSAAELLERQLRFSQAAEKFAALAAAQHNLSLPAAYRAAELYLRLAKYGRAAELLQNILHNYTGEEDLDKAFFLLGETYRRQGALAQALECYQNILVRFPDSFYTDGARKQARAISSQLEAQRHEN